MEWCCEHRICLYCFVERCACAPSILPAMHKLGLWFCFFFFCFFYFLHSFLFFSFLSLFVLWMPFALALKVLLIYDYFYGHEAKPLHHLEHPQMPFALALKVLLIYDYYSGQEASEFELMSCCLSQRRTSSWLENASPYVSYPPLLPCLSLAWTAQVCRACSLPP